MQDRVVFTSSSNIWTEVKALHNNNSFADVTIHCRDGRVYANALILANLNHFWFNVLTSDFTKEDFEIFLLDETKENINEFLQASLKTNLFLNDNPKLTNNKRNFGSENFQNNLKCEIKIKEENFELGFGEENGSNDIIDTGFIKQEYSGNYDDYLDYGEDNAADSDYVDPMEVATSTAKSRKRKKTSPVKRSATTNTSGKPKKREFHLWNEKKKYTHRPNTIKFPSKKNIETKWKKTFQGDKLCALNEETRTCRVLLEKGENDNAKIHTALHYICAATYIDIYQFYCGVREFKFAKRDGKAVDWPYISALHPRERIKKRFILKKAVAGKHTLPDYEEPSEKENCLKHKNVFDMDISASPIQSLDFVQKVYTSNYKLEVSLKDDTYNTFHVENFDFRSSYSVGTLEANQIDSDERIYHELFETADHLDKIDIDSQFLKDRYVRLFQLLYNWLDFEDLLKALDSCPYLNYKYEYDFYLVKKNFLSTMMTEKNEKEFCEICQQDIGFKVYSKVNKVKDRHLEKVHFICSLCKSQCDNPTDLGKHKRRVHKGLEDKKCPVEGCTYVYQIKSLLDHHMGTMHTEKVSCSKCGKYYAPNMIKIHEGTCGKYETCKVCHKIIMKRDMSGHMKRQHPKDGKGKHLCSQCASAFTTKTNLKKHVISMHTPDHLKPAQCEHCGKGFISDYALRKHEVIHLNTRPYQCRFCDNRYNDSSMVKQHEKAKHPVEFEQIRKAQEEAEIRMKLCT